MVNLAFRSWLGVQLTKEQEHLNLDLLGRLGPLRGGKELKYRVTLRGVLEGRPWPLMFRHLDGGYSCFGRPDERDCLALFVIRWIVSEGN